MLDGTDAFIENRTFDELMIGDTASMSHTVTQRDIDLFALATGDVNPAHVDSAYAETSMFHHVIIHGMWGAGLISAVLGTKLPGPGTIYMGQDLRFRHPVSIGDTITATVTVREKKTPKGDVTLDCVCTNQHGKAVITGTAETRAPTMKIRRPRVTLPDIQLSRHDATGALLAHAAGGVPVVAAVVHPVDAGSLLAALDAAAAGLIVPVLIGPAARIQDVAGAAGVDLLGLRLVDAPNAPAAAVQAVELACAGEVGLLMMGDLHTREVIAAVAASGAGLRTGRPISHACLLDVPAYPRPLLLTNAAINAPLTLAEQAGIVQNAISLAHAVGIAQPRVAILAPVETDGGRTPNTLDAAALGEMARIGQIAGGVLDGPFSLDCAVSEVAAAAEGIVSAIAGRADILVVSSPETGSALARALVVLAGAEAPGVVLGARVPIILANRTDSAHARRETCALGVLMAQAGGATNEEATGAHPNRTVTHGAAA